MITFSLCLLFCFFLNAVHIDDCKMKDMRQLYKCFDCVFPKAVGGYDTLEIKFVRQDETLCGAHWRVSDVGGKGWFLVGSAIQYNVCRDAPIDALLLRNVCEEFQGFLARNHDCVRPIPGLPMMTVEDMADVLEPPPVEPWAVALTTESMRGKMPGTLRLTAPGAECCLLREPKENAASESPQGLPGQIATLQGIVLGLSQNVRSDLQNLKDRLGLLEENFASLKQRLTETDTI